MTPNVGGIERPVRIFIGLVLIAIGSMATLPLVWMAVTLTAGVVAVATGAVGYCPVWALLGMNTCSTTQRRNHTGKAA